MHTKTGIYNLERKDRWHDHEPKTVLKNDEAKILWHVPIQHDHIIEARADIVVFMKKGMVCIECKQALCGTRTGWNLIHQGTSLQAY